MLVLINCVIWSFTTKLDEMAVSETSKWTYLAYGKLMTGMWAALGAAFAKEQGTDDSSAKKKDDELDSRPTSVALLAQPHVLGSLFAVACCEGFYML
eukprot:SAG31_NODE_25776_length_454_cov_1.315493_1_plen_97_part_00